MILRMNGKSGPLRGNPVINLWVLVYGPNPGHPPRKKRKAGGDASQPKNPVALLNEMRQGLAYTMESQSGPVHAPLFTISVEVGGSAVVI